MRELVVLLSTALVFSNVKVRSSLVAGTDAFVSISGVIFSEIEV